MIILWCVGMVCLIIIGLLMTCQYLAYRLWEPKEHKCLTFKVQCNPTSFGMICKHGSFTNALCPKCYTSKINYVFNNPLTYVVYIIYCSRWNNPKPSAFRDWLASAKRGHSNDCGESFDHCQRCEYDKYLKLAKSIMKGNL